MQYTYEAYEDNAGGLHIFALDDEGAVVWGSIHYGEEYEAAQDWAGLMAQGCDPVAEGWESPDGIEEDYESQTYPGSRQIASSDWDHLPLGIDVDDLAIAGKRFAVELGVLYRCHECGEYGECVATWTGGPREAPERCECCGARLS